MILYKYFFINIYLRDLILGGRTPTWGLIVLLISKAGGLEKGFSDIDKDVTAGKVIIRN